MFKSGFEVFAGFSGSHFGIFKTGTFGRSVAPDLTLYTVTRSRWVQRSGGLGQQPTLIRWFGGFLGRRRYADRDVQAFWLPRFALYRGFS